MSQIIDNNQNEKHSENSPVAETNSSSNAPTNSILNDPKIALQPAQSQISNTNSQSISVDNSVNPIPPPPSHPAPIPKSKSRSDTIIPYRWRPDANLRSNKAMTRIRRGRRYAMSKRASRMSETAKRMLGLMSVMMAGRAQGVTTGVYSKQSIDVQTGLDGNICYVSIICVIIMY